MIVLFQYILCVGSRYTKVDGFWGAGGFNTSYVSVQGIEKHIDKIYDDCFNTSYVSVQGVNSCDYEEITRFQYILCVGSRKCNRVIY